MEHQENQLLEQYASILKRKVLSSQTDLAPKDHAMPEMLHWCRRKEAIVVLKSRAILCNNPSSRLVQNCKIVMQDKGIAPGPVFPASKALIELLLANAPERHVAEISPEKSGVSSQQQRLRNLIQEALSQEVTDIHIEVRQTVAKIRFRKHGELYLHAEWLPKIAREISSVAFNKETDHAISHFNPLVPQNASMPLKVSGHEVRLRLASLPAHHGFDVVLRILTTSDDAVESLSGLGYSSEQVQLLRKAIKMPYGAVIVSGPTGSGKTTTLASCMNLVSPERKIYTIEDPVEKIIQGATQIPVNTEQTDRGFASMARTVLRMDPDVMVLGEMRDEDTASVMIRAAITGHLVFSTLHTQSAVGIVTRLIDLGVSPRILANPNLLVCLVCQRLVPILCQHCAVDVSTSPSHWQRLGRMRDLFGRDGFDKVRIRGSKCSECHHTGISGRTVVAEVLWIDETDRQYIQTDDILGWKQHLRHKGWTPFNEKILVLVKEGKLDPRDAEKIIGEMLG